MSKKEKEEKKKAEVKIKELPAKIKEIKEGEMEESELEEELEEAESSNFNDFMTSRQGGITPTLVPEEAVVERATRYAASRENVAPSETPSHMRYEQTTYTPAQKVARITAPILRAGGASAPNHRERDIQDLERFRDERLRAREEKSETYQIEAKEHRTKSKMPWE